MPFAHDPTASTEITNDGQALAHMFVYMATRNIAALTEQIDNHAIAAATYLAPTDQLNAERIATTQQHLDEIRDLHAARVNAEQLLERYSKHL